MSTTTKPRQRAARAGKATAYRMYVDGKFVDAKSGQTFDVYDPASEEVMATCPAGGPADVDRAAKAAHRAFYGGWKTATAQERGRILLRLAERVRARRAELAELETRNSGKPIAESEYDMDDTATCFEYYGGLATKINGEVLPVPADAVAFAMREPMGVAGQIIPWNYPLMMAAWKIAPALAAGCTVVLKPAEQTPLSILELAKDFEEVGLPPGGGQHRDRRRSRRRRAARHPSRGPEDRLHRERRGRQAHHAERRRPAQAGLARAGRQVSQHLLQRRRLRERGGRRAVRGVREPGRGVLRGQPGPGAADDLPEVRGRGRGQGEDASSSATGSIGPTRWVRWSARLSATGWSATRSSAARRRRWRRAAGCRRSTTGAGTWSPRSSTTWTTTPGSRRRRSSGR